MTRTVLGLFDFCTPPNSEFATNVNLIYYPCDGTNATSSYPITKPEEMLKVLNKDKTTIFYVFGFLQYPGHPVVQLMTNALCDGKTDNIVLLDWSKYSGASAADFLSAYENSKQVGILFAESVRQLRNAGLKESKIYIIGFSLGAHIAGTVGKCNKDFKVSRITGLDPANPNFDFAILPYTLKSTDAAWVDVIHTDMALDLKLIAYGSYYIQSMATAHFFANNGTRYQPNCTSTPQPFTPEDFCSHRRAVEVYAMSKLSPNKFIATQCPDSDNYNRGQCDGKPTTVVGYNAPIVEGSYWFKTN